MKNTTLKDRLVAQRGVEVTKAEAERLAREREALKQALRFLADTFDVRASDVVFTSGGRGLDTPTGGRLHFVEAPQVEFLLKPCGANKFTLYYVSGWGSDEPIRSAQALLAVLELS